MVYVSLIHAVVGPGRVVYTREPNATRLPTEEENMRKTVVMLLALALSVTVLALAGCGGGNADSPEQVVEEFMSATLAEDAEAVYELLSAATQAELTSTVDLVEGSADAIDSYEVGEATISGDEARVATSIALTGLDGPLEFEVVLVKEDGAWKISLSETGASMDEAFEELMGEMEIPE
jgi:predicted small lipoprotein YifL